MNPHSRTGPFLRQEGLRQGLTKHQVDGAAFHKAFGCVRIPVELPLTPHVLAQAALLVVPTAAVSHHTAARLWAGAAPDSPEVHVSVPRHQDRRSRDGLACHVNPSARLRRKGSLVLTSPAQTFWDLSADLDLVDLVILGDSLVHSEALTEGELLGLLDHATGPYARCARRAAELVRHGAESPMETRARLLVVMAGFPEPTLQYSVTRHDGGPRYRFDLCYPELKVAIEYDGRHHAQNDRQWAHDLTRREWLDGQGWRLIVLRSSDIFATPWRTAQRVGEVLSQCGYEKPLPANAPTSFAAHFPAQPWRMPA